MLNEYETKKHDVILKLISREITVKEAMEILDLKERQIYNLKNIFKEQGKDGFIHKSRGRKNPNKKDDKLIKEIEDLYLNEYYDYNFIQFYEDVIFGKYNISYDVMLKTFTKDDIISPLAHRKTVKEYKEKMNTVIKVNNPNNDSKEEKIELYKSRIIESEKAHTRSSNGCM